MLANLYEWRNSKYPKAALKFLGAYSDFKSLISSKKKNNETIANFLCTCCNLCKAPYYLVIKRAWIYGHHGLF